MSRFYKHVAPLGLNAAQFSVRHPSQGLGFLAQRVGEPNPYGFNGAVASWFFNPCNPLIHVIRDSDNSHMPPLWGFGYLVYAARL